LFRNYLITALRNLARNRLYAAISILGLAVAFAAAILIAQFVRGEFSYDRWVPGYQQVYRVSDVWLQPGQAPWVSDEATGGLAGRLRTQFSGAAAVARLLEDPDAPLRRRAGDPQVAERTFAWVDPDFFKVFPLPTLAGDLQRALQQPDSLVITRRMARKYFGRDLPLGETLQVQAIEPLPKGRAQPPPEARTWRAMRVAAVVDDLPPNTNLTTEIFASGRSAFSGLAYADRDDPGSLSNFTFVRLEPQVTAADLQRALDAAAGPDAKVYAGFYSRFSFRPVPLQDLHLTAANDSADVVQPTGSQGNAYAFSAAGALIVLVAAINFVTLLTARASRRALEVGVRKATGASRADLMIQFIGEALIQVGLSAVVAMALAELLIGPFGALTQRRLALDYLHDPALLAGIAGSALVVGLLAAIYPALVLSSFRPASVLKGGLAKAAGSAPARQALVVVQFAILVGLIVTTATLYRQTEFALARGLGGGADSGKIVQVTGGCIDGAFPGAVRRLEGVGDAACSSTMAATTGKSFIRVLVGGQKESFDEAPVDFGFLELYGLKPLAGRVFSRAHGADGTFFDPKGVGHTTVVLNEAAARRLGFSDPKAAVGHILTYPTRRPSEIIGVAPDMPPSVRTATDPTLYYVYPKVSTVLSIKLTGRDIPGTLKAIDRAWKRIGHPQPIKSTFLSQYRLSLYLDLILQSTTIAICAGLAVLIACLGLFALSAYATERRTKEIGVRKAMGADTRQVVLLLLWQFTIPVLIATAVAVPIGFLAMGWWLQGFAYHVPLSAWTFVLAAGAAVGIAWLTVSYQSLMVARARPSSALRYE
jgi:putative ABC transport system permease protein